MDGSLRQRESAPTSNKQSQRTESQSVTVHFRNYDIFEANTVILHFHYAESRDRTTTKQIHLKPGEYTTDIPPTDDPVTSIRASLNKRNESMISLAPDDDHVVLLECGNGAIDITKTEHLPYHSHQSTTQ